MYLDTGKSGDSKRLRETDSEQRRGKMRQETSG
jgi:hypothetical protein